MGSQSSSRSRFRFSLIIALLLVLAPGSFWVLEVMRRGVNDVMPAIREHQV